MKRLLLGVVVGVISALPAVALAQADVDSSFSSAIAAVKSNDMGAACRAFAHLSAVSHGFADVTSPELARVHVANGSSYMTQARTSAAAGNSETACALAYASALAWRKGGDEFSTRASLHEANGYARQAGVAVEAPPTHSSTTASMHRAASPVTADRSGDWFAKAQPGDLSACARTSSGSTGEIVAAARSCAEAQFLKGEQLRAAGRYQEALAAYDAAKKYAQITGMGITMSLKENDPRQSIHNAILEKSHPFSATAAGLEGHYKCYFYGYQGLSLSKIGYIEIVSPSTYETTYLHAGNRGTWRYQSLPKNPSNDIYAKLIFTGGPFAGHYAYANRKANGDRAIIWPHNEAEKPWDTSDTWCYFDPRG